MTEKLDWSKLSEMPVYAPTRPGWYQLANGLIGYVQGPDELSDWKISLNPGNAIFFRKTGEVITKTVVGDDDKWRIVKYLGDVMPWEECERFNRDIHHTAVLCGLTPADGDTETHTLNRIIAKVRTLIFAQSERASTTPHDYDLIRHQRDQYESELRAAEELNRKWESVHDALKAERDEWKRAAESQAKPVTQILVSADTDMRLANAEIDIERLQQRVAKLEEFHQSFTNPVACYATMPQANEPQPAVTEEPKPTFKVGDVVVKIKNANQWPEVRIGDATQIANVHEFSFIDKNGWWFEAGDIRHATAAERAAFFAANPTLHPAYKPEHGDMKGWRYLEPHELLEETDNFWNYHANAWSNFAIRVGEPQFNNGHPYRRRVQAEKEASQ